MPVPDAVPAAPLPALPPDGTFQPSLLETPERHPLRPGRAAAALGRTVVLAPHADDESLGCGGLLALLADAAQPATVVVVTDGTQSHPRSVTHPAPRLRALREAEARTAVAHLGHATRVEFLRFADCGLPAPGSDAFDRAADRLAALVDELRPHTLLVPWRRDPHGDHEATWRLAWARRQPDVRWIEYPVWAWTRPETAPTQADASAWRLDVTAVRDRKRAAIAAHRSQHGLVIHDDPGGFALPTTMLAAFDGPWELFLDPHDA